MSLIKHLLTEITDAKKEALRKIYNKKYYNLNDQQIAEAVADNMGSTQDISRVYNNFINRKQLFFETILSIDSTTNNIYTQWLITKGIPSKYSDITRNLLGFIGKYPYTYINKTLEDDAPRITEYLNIFDMMKKKKDFPIKDINQLSSLEQLLDAIKPYLISPTENVYKFIKQKLDTKVIDESDVDILYDDAKTLIVAPLTKLGACTIGADAEWCTAWGKHSFNPRHKSKYNHFDTYYEDTDDISELLVAFIDKQGKNHYQIDLNATDDNGIKPEIKDANDTQQDILEMYDALSVGAKSWFIDRIKESDKYIDINDSSINTEIYYKGIHVKNDGDKKVLLFKDEDDFLEDFLSNNDYHIYGRIIRDGYVDSNTSIYLDRNDEWDEKVTEKIISILLPLIDAELSKEYTELKDSIDVLEDLKNDTKDSNIYTIIYDTDLNTETISDALSSIRDVLINAKTLAYEDSLFNEVYGETMKTAISNVYGYNKSWSIIKRDAIFYFTDNDSIAIDVTHLLNKTKTAKSDDEQIVQYFYNNILEDGDNEVELPYNVEEPYYGFNGDISWYYASELALENLNDNF